jgi:hypothetical protein
MRTCSDSRTKSIHTNQNDVFNSRALVLRLTSASNSRLKQKIQSELARGPASNSNSIAQFEVDACNS